MDVQSTKRRYGIIGGSDKYDGALSIALRVAPTDLTILISGESGVGKEVFSKIIHQQSPRKHNSFIAVNCGAIPEGTIDSELFGHEKGAFTGAVSSRKGYFEEVNGGTIFLDEIGEMPLGTQARLLRVLESGEFISVGSSKVQKTDVRVVAATNKDLMSLIQKGKFREDLYYRLSTVPIHVPPLRERREDIYKLFRKFSSDFADKHKSETIGLDDEAKAMIQSYAWPGNIRELKNFSEQISVLSLKKTLDRNDVLHYLPKANRTNNLPVLSGRVEEGQGDISDREILYKVLFDMRKDLNEMKKIVFALVQNGTVSPEVLQEDMFREVMEMQNGERPAVGEGSGPFIINSGQPQTVYEPSEVVEESLSIADMEKKQITKALQKHRGRRKDAALDLGISERTLYRKIKEYEINE